MSSPWSAQKPAAASGARYSVPGYCSKTGEAIIFICSLSDERLHIEEMVLVKQAATRGANPLASSERLPPFASGPYQAFCPSCHIRVRKGPTLFQCGVSSCRKFQCMGSHWVENGEIWTQCSQCKNTGPLGGHITEVQGTRAASAGPSLGTTSPSSSTKRLG
jgi:hypothetical protein